MCNTSGRKRVRAKGRSNDRICSKAPPSGNAFKRNAFERRRLWAKCTWAASHPNGNAFGQNALGRRHLWASAPRQTHPSKRARTDCVRPKTHSSKTRSVENALEQNASKRKRVSTKRLRIEARLNRMRGKRTQPVRNAIGNGACRFSVTFRRHAANQFAQTRRPDLLHP